VLAVAQAGHPLWHLLAVLLLPAVLIVGFTYYDRIRAEGAGRGATERSTRTSRPRVSRDRTIAPLAAASGAASLVHLEVCPAHFAEDPLFGYFFLLLFAAQLSWAVAISRRPSPTLFILGAVGNAGVVALWLYTRIIGLGFGPNAGRTESFGASDVVAATFEMIIVILIVLPFRHGRWKRISYW
jgi:hypothetical protein